MTRVNIAREIANPLLDYATYYRFRWHLTYCYFDFATYLISFIFGVFWAGKITLTLYLLLLLDATRFLLKSVSAPLFPFMLWPLLFAYNWWFWIGSINLLVGFCFGMYAIGLTWKNKDSFENGPLNMRLVLKLFLLLMFSAACHPISVALAVLVIVPIVLSAKFKGNKKAISIAVFVMFVVALETLGHLYYRQPWELVKNVGRSQWLLHDFYAPGSQARVFKMAFLAALCMWLFVKEKDIVRCFFLPAFCALLVLLTPHSIDISGDNDLRCSFFTFLLVPFFVPSPSKKTWKILVSLVFLCCGLYWNIEQIKKQLKYNETYLEIERIAHSVPPAPRVYQFCADLGKSDQQAAAYITFFKGGFYGAMFASPFHGLAYLWRPDCKNSESVEKLDAQCALFYNCVIVNKNDGYKPLTTEKDLTAMDFSKQFEGKHFDCYLRKTIPR